MARFLTTTTPLVLPKKHSRAYYASTKQAAHTMRRTTHPHVPPRALPPPPYALYWGAWPATVNRQYMALIGAWWKSGNIPNGKAFWEALAADVPIANNRGATVTLTGHQWFIWYQRKALACHTYTWTNFQPAPAYELGPEPGTFPPFPDWPRGPWTPGPAPAVVAVRAHAYGNLEIDILDPPRPYETWGCTWAKLTRNIAPSPARQRTILGQAMGISKHTAPFLYTVEVLPARVLPPFPPGLTGTLHAAWIDINTQVPSQESTTDFAFA